MWLIAQRSCYLKKLAILLLLWYNPIFDTFKIKNARKACCNGLREHFLFGFHTCYIFSFLFYGF